MAGNKVYVQGNYVDVHDNKVVNLSIDKVGEVHVGDGQGTSDCVIPDVLNSKEAEEIMENLVDAGLLDEEWQAANLSGTEQALVAKAISAELDIKDVWQVFGSLWNVKPETLRTYFNRALEQKKSLKFQEKLKNILG